jgi:hypothetical protein
MSKASPATVDAASRIRKNEAPVDKPTGRPKTAILGNGAARATLNIGENDAAVCKETSTRKRADFKDGGSVFEREDHALFCSLNTLGQKAGVPTDRIAWLVAKELVDNALDVCGSCRVGLLERNGFWVEDDGDGIPYDDARIAWLFSVRRPLASSKILRRPTRGAMGKGLRVVAGAVISTGGSLFVSTQGRTLQLIPQEDTGDTLARPIGVWDGKGTRVEVEFGPAIRVDGHSLDWAEEAVRMAMWGSSYSRGSSPHWYDSESFYELLRASGDRTARELIAEMQGCSEPKAGRIAREFKGRLARDLDREEAERLLLTARSRAKPVRPKALGHVGRHPLLPPGYAIRRGYVELGSARSCTKADLPFVLEAWASVSEEASARLFVNRTPLTGDIQAWHNKMSLCLSGCGLGEVYYEIPSGRRPANLRVNIDVPYMPITTDGKEPDVRPFIRDIVAAAGQAIRRAKAKAPSARDAPQTKKQFFFDRIPEGARRAGGGHRFGQRQLLYALRPDFLEAFGEEPRWGTFTKIVTDYENAIDSDVPDMYRDPRGIIYHPHLGQEIPLGTLYVERYMRPAWLFNKVLYCEKEGFFSILRAVLWPERNDCALMTSKGFSTRAARDFIDMLSETGEECEFFCIHDADAAGTMIHQTLQDATKARGARKVRIHNLGLYPAEARDMGLQVERLRRPPEQKKKRLPVARDVPRADRVWLQSHRIELNAMTTPQFLEWLDRKFKPFRGKLIPPHEVMAERFKADVVSGIEQELTAEVLREADIKGRAEREYARRSATIEAKIASLDPQVRRALGRDDSLPWTEVVDRLARKAIAGAKRTGGRPT